MLKYDGPHSFHFVGGFFQPKSGQTNIRSLCTTNFVGVNYKTIAEGTGGGGCVTSLSVFVGVFKARYFGDLGELCCLKSSKG